MVRLFEYEGLKLETRDSVYIPAEDSLLAAGFIAKYLDSESKHDLNVLDMGTGTGILGLVAARSPNVKRVTFADINPDALDIAKRNCDANRSLLKAECDFAMSDLFLGIYDNYDIIIFNAPYLRSEGGASGDPRWDGGSSGVETSKRFLRESVKRLNQHGTIFLVYSSLSDTDALKEYAAGLGLRVVDSRSTRIFFEEITVARFERTTGAQS